MPLIKSAKKALRQSKKREAENRVIKRELRKTIKDFKQAPAEKAEGLMPLVYKKIDKAAKRGLLKKNTASRKKSRLSRLVTK